MNTVVNNGLISAEVKRAEEFDANNQHQEAINTLAAAIDNGDVEAMTRLGKRLLIGDRAPVQSSKGGQLLGKASVEGGAEAMAILSVLYAVGELYEQSWPRALTCLTLAAERGWESAQEQLRLLTTDQNLAQRESSATLWQELASSIDLEAWNKPPQEYKMLSESPLVLSYPDFIPKNICQWIVKNSEGSLKPAMVYDSVSQTETTNAVRSNTVRMFNLIDTNFINILIQARMSASVNIPFRHLEAITVLHYDVGQQIANHYDFIDPDSPDYEEQIRVRGQRVITFLAYLNDDYEGGETEFPTLEVSHKGQCGEGLFFVNALDDGSADIRSLHAGRPIAFGEKWIITQFIRNLPTF